jgi:hydroxylamine reductase (hybrid-cluster protein)
MSNRVKIKAKCGHEGCKRRAKAKHECLTCEKLVEAGKQDTVFFAAGCGHHAQEAIERIKKHALTAHPVNILRGVVAQLKGGDVF